MLTEDEETRISLFLSFLRCVSYLPSRQINVPSKLSDALTVYSIISLSYPHDMYPPVTNILCAHLFLYWILHNCNTCKWERKRDLDKHTGSTQIKCLLRGNSTFRELWYPTDKPPSLIFHLTGEPRVLSDPWQCRAVRLTAASCSCRHQLHWGCNTTYPTCHCGQWQPEQPLAAQQR